MLMETATTHGQLNSQHLSWVLCSRCHLGLPLFRVAFLLCGLVMFLALAESVCDDQIVFRADPEVHCLSCAS